MSHIVVIETKIHDATALTEACRRLELAEPVHRNVRLFSDDATGLSVKLPGWRYPIVVDTANGSIKYDNYEGRWGNPDKLGRLLQMYAVEKAKIEARKQGHSVTERPLTGGSIKVTVQVGAGR